MDATIANALIGLAAAVLTPFASAALFRLTQRFGLERDDKVRAYLTSGIEIAIQYGEAEARRRLTGQDVRPDKERLRALTVQLAADYTRDRWPDAVKHFKLGQDALERMVGARLPKPPAPFVG